MGKKKGKKGKKKGKKSSKSNRSKKAAPPQMTFSEAILAYKINLIEKKLEDVSFEVNGWEEKNIRAKARNVTLTEERDVLAQNTLKQFHEVRQKNEELCSRESVTEALKSVWDYRTLRKADISKLDKESSDIDQQIEMVKKEIKQWHKYKETTMKFDAMEIRLLEQELRDIVDTYGDMIDFIETDIEKTKESIVNAMNSLLEKQKDLASNNAMAFLDKYSLQEVRDNEWLQQEVQIHEQLQTELEDEVNEMEKHNLSIMSELFDCRVDDLKIYSTFYLTQIDEHEQLENSDLLQIDLDHINRSGEVTSADLRKHAEEREHLRPKSATLRAIEDRIFPLILHSLSEDESADSMGDNSKESTAHQEFSHHGSPYEDHLDFLNPGPMELKMLSVTGHELPIHRVSQSAASEDQKTSDWPITHHMIQTAIMPNS